MRSGTVWIGVLGWALLLACGEASTRQAAEPAPDVAATGEKATDAAAGAGSAPAGAEPATLAPQADRTDGGEAETFPGCPEDSEERRLSIDKVGTDLRWCEKTAEDGRAFEHGPWRKRQDGRLVEAGSFRDGQRDGPWTLYWSAGPRQSAGDYRAGRRIGVWTFWSTAGEEIRRHDYGAGEAPRDEPPAAREAPAARELPLRVENLRGDDLLVTLEPEGEAYLVSPGASIELRLPSGLGEPLVLQSGEDTLTVQGSGPESEAEREPARP